MESRRLESKKSGKHMSLDRRFFVVSGEEILVESQSKFTQGIHGSVSIFTEKTAVIFGKGDIQKPVQGLNLPVFPRQRHKVFRGAVTT